jgi:hypothetical protein
MDESSFRIEMPVNSSMIILMHGIAIRKLTRHSVNLLLAVFTLGSATSIGSQVFAQYCNARFGFCADYPRDLIMEPPPENGDGRRFRDTNGFLLVISGINNVLEETVDSELKSDLKSFKKVMYQSKGKNWFVLSGFQGLNVVYLKTFVGKGAINHLTITYPAARKAAYPETVTRISRSFKPGDLSTAH